MNLAQQKRLARLMFSERSKPIVQLFRKYKNAHLPYTEFMPGPVDLCNWTKVKIILNSPADVKIDESSFSDIVPLFDDFVRRWRNYMHLRLLHQSRRVEDTKHRQAFLLGYDKEDKDDDFDAKPLRQFQALIPDLLNQTVFVCDECTPPLSLWISGQDPLYFERERAEPLYYPEVLDHHCLTRKLSKGDRTQSTDSLKHLEHYERDRASWNCRILSVETCLGKIFEAIVTLAGQEPVSTSARDMDQLDMWFACMNPACLTLKTNPNYWAQAVNWRNAVSSVCIALRP